jgi:broad specificity phosphatase PhoE
MKGQLTLICHGATASNRTATFPADEPLEEQAVRKTEMLAGQLRRYERTWIAPALRTRQTADILSLTGPEEASLGECDYGRWAGRRLADIQSEEPEGLEAWMTDVSSAPHEGESLSRLFGRAADWMDRRLSDGGHAVAITHASIIRAAILHVLQAPPQAFWKIDIEPLSLTEFGSDGRRWTLRFPDH